MLDQRSSSVAAPRGSAPDRRSPVNLCALKIHKVILLFGSLTHVDYVVVLVDRAGHRDPSSARGRSVNIGHSASHFYTGKFMAKVNIAVLELSSQASSWSIN